MLLLSYFIVFKCDGHHLICVKLSSVVNGPFAQFGIHVHNIFGTLPALIFSRIKSTHGEVGPVHVRSVQIVDCMLNLFHYVPVS